jgi:hypothetical protein
MNMKHDEQSQDLGTSEHTGMEIAAVDDPSSEDMPVKDSEVAYDEFAAGVLKSVAEFDAKTEDAEEELLHETYFKLQQIYELHLVGIQNPTQHAAFLKKQGVKSNKRTTPELATVKAVYPRKHWGKRSPRMTSWKRALIAFGIDRVSPAEVPQWLRNPMLDADGKEIRGFAKVDAVLRQFNTERTVLKSDPEEKFRAQVEEHLMSPVATLSAGSNLPDVSGYAVMLVHADRGEIKVLDVADEQGFFRKIALERWR